MMRSCPWQSRTMAAAEEADKILQDLAFSMLKIFKEGDLEWETKI